MLAAPVRCHRSDADYVGLGTLTRRSGTDRCIARSECPLPRCIMVSALQAGAPIGLSATDAWDKAAAGDAASYAP
jgi:hypothetical protein